MWDLPRPGLEPVSPALAGGFLTTGLPGKSLAFQDEQFRLGSKKEEALTTSSGDSLKHSNKGRKALGGTRHPKSLQSRLSCGVSQVTTLITNTINSHVRLAGFCILRYTYKYPLGRNVHKT